MLRVNGELIDPQLIEEAFTRIKTEAEQRLQVSCCERDPEFSEMAEEEVANSILIAQEAEKRYPKIDEDQVKSELRKVLDIYRQHDASWEMLEQQRDSLRQEVSATLRMEQLIASVLGDDSEVSEEEVVAFYEAQRGDYTSPAEARSLHIMKPLENGQAPPELYQSMCDLREEALNGGDFEAIATRETQKSTGEIDLGWIPLDRPTNPFEAVLFSLRVGETSPVLVYEHALHLVQVTERKDAHTQPLEEVREEIESRALAAKKRGALQKLAETLRKDAVIEHVDYSEPEPQTEQ